VSRIAFNVGVPWTEDGLVDQVAATLPVRVRPATEGIGDVLPPLPPLRRDRDQACREPARDGDVDLLTALDPAHQIRCVLTELSKPYGSH